MPKAWVINFSGIGNAVIMLPLLKCLEISFPSVFYFYTANELTIENWFIRMAKLSNFVGHTPAHWRRFQVKDWKSIYNFLRVNNVRIIINVRNEGPKFDHAYYQFKEFLDLSKFVVDYWELDFELLGNRIVQENLTGDILKLFYLHGVKVENYNAKWLGTLSLGNSKKIVGFGLAASQKNKRWSAFKWIKLAQLILNHTNLNIILICGNTETEALEANLILQQINSNRITVFSNKFLKNITFRIAEFLCFITNDTGILHLSAACNIPTFGIYISTDSLIWSPLDQSSFISFQNSFYYQCFAIKPFSGNCMHYYDGCPIIEGFGDDIESEIVFSCLLNRILNDN